MFGLVQGVGVEVESSMNQTWRAARNIASTCVEDKDDLYSRYRCVAGWESRRGSLQVFCSEVVKRRDILQVFCSELLAAVIPRVLPSRTIQLPPLVRRSI